MNIAPPPEVLRALRNQNYTWKDALGELIDNAFDAGATQVTICWEGKDLIVTDNGNGCTDLAGMLTIGRHLRQPGTKLGRYGIGLKDTALWLGGPTIIKSTRGNKSIAAKVDWEALERSGSWDIPDPVIMDAEPTDRGTSIRFHKQQRTVPDGQAFKQLVEEIGYVFSPAIRQGRQILFRRRAGGETLAERYALPDLIDVVDTTAIVDGKSIHIHVGVVREGVSNPRPGITYTHGFRVIMPACGLGCGSEFSYSRVAGWVALDTGWRLTKNKDGISAHRDDLGDAVYAACKSTIAKAAGQAWVIQSSQLAHDLTRAVQLRLRAQQNTKARRGKGEDHGTRNPTGTGGKHRKARQLQPGQKVMHTLRAGTLRVDFAALGPSTIGDVDAAGNTVRLSTDHPYIADLSRLNDRRGLLAIVGGLLVNHDIVADDGQLILGIADAAMDARFGVGLASFLSAVDGPQAVTIGSANADIDAAA